MLGKEDKLLSIKPFAVGDYLSRQREDGERLTPVHTQPPGEKKGGYRGLELVRCDARRMLLPRNHIYNVKRIWRGSC